MNKKRFLVLGIALILFALVVGSVFAFGFENGVRWEIVQLENRLVIQLYNSNDFAVRVGLSNAWQNPVELAPEELKNVNVSSPDARITYVLKRDRNGYWERF